MDLSSFFFFFVERVAVCESKEAIDHSKVNISKLLLLLDPIVKRSEKFLKTLEVKVVR